MRHVPPPPPSPAPVKIEPAPAAAVVYVHEDISHYAITRMPRTKEPRLPYIWTDTYRASAQGAGDGHGS